MDTEDVHFQESSGKNTTSYLIRCTNEQKEFLQKTIVASGQTAAQFLVEAANFASQKNSEDLLLTEELAQVDSLIGRLTRLMKAKVYLAHEKEMQISEELKALDNEKSALETLKQKKMSEIEEELNARRTLLENEFLGKEELRQIQIQEEKKEWEGRIHMLQEEVNRLQTSLKQKAQESAVREKQYLDSVKLHENIEQRNVELKQINEELKCEILELKNKWESMTIIEKERDELKTKITLLEALHKQELKNIYHEFELKSKILIHEVEKNYFHREDPIIKKEI